MTTATDTDLQQIKDLIAAGQLATQKQIAESALNTQKQIAGVEVAVAKLEGKIDATNAEIKGIHTELSDIKSNQKSQDMKFWTLVLLILTSSIGLIGKLTKLY